MTEPTREPRRRPTRPRGAAPWLWALAALIVLALVILLLLRACDDNDDNGSKGGPTATSTGTGGGTSTVPTAGPGETGTGTGSATTPGGPEPEPPSATSGGAGSLTVNGQSILPKLGGSLSQFADQQVEAKHVEVISVPGDEVFWAGTSESQQLLVQINTKGESPQKVRAGQRVTFVGALLPNGSQTFGVTEDEGSAMLKRQGVHAFVSLIDLKLR